MLYVEHISCVITNCGQYLWVITSPLSRAPYDLLEENTTRKLLSGPIFRLVLQNLAIPVCFPGIIFYRYRFSLLSSGWLVIAVCGSVSVRELVNTLRPRQNGRLFADDTFKRIFLNENVGISIKISLKFVHKGPINNIPALVQIMAWRRPGDKPLSEPIVVRLPTHICVTRPHWVKY